MAILYGIKKAVLTELDPATGLPVTTNGKKVTITTAEEATLTPVISEGSEEVLRTAEKILAVVREDDLLYGYDLTFKDNTFSAECAELIAGYKKELEGEKLSVPMLTEGNNCKPFKLDLYIANYVGDTIENYCQITFNKCIGKFPEIKIGKEFFAPEFEVKARENTKASLPIKDIDWVDTLPA